METLLPQVTPPAIPEVDLPRVAPMGLTEGTAQAVGVLGHHDQVDMAGLRQ